ncbi:hypothetical protein F7725_010339, partial [Dissostichus mawsoni]
MYKCLVMPQGDVTVLLKNPAKPTHMKLWELVSLSSFFTEAISVCIPAEHHVCFSPGLGVSPLPGQQPQQHARSPPSVWTTWLLHKDYLEQQSQPEEITGGSQEGSLTPPLTAYWGWKKGVSVRVNGTLAFTYENSTPKFDLVEGLILGYRVSCWADEQNDTA